MAVEIIEDDVLDPNEPTEVPPDTEAMDPQALATSLEEDTQVTPEATPTPQEAPEDTIPDKYKGKSISEVIGMHQEAERLVGRHSGEVGELRKVVDGFIQNQLPTPATETPKEPKPDFFEDPEAAVSEAIENHPTVKAAKDSATRMQQTESLGRIVQKHPDMKDILSDPKFGEWVQGSPIRMELYQRADKDFDFDSADELIGQYKERTKVVTEAAKTEVDARAQQVKAASTGSATGAASTGTTGGKVYRRVDIINLMKNDPDRYESLSGEIQKAYAEGRVR